MIAAQLSDSEFTGVVRQTFPEAIAGIASVAVLVALVFLVWRWLRRRRSVIEGEG